MKLFSQHRFLLLVCNIGSDYHLAYYVIIPWILADVVAHPLRFVYILPQERILPVSLQLVGEFPADASNMALMVYTIGSSHILFTHFSRCCYQMSSQSHQPTPACMETPNCIWRIWLCQSKLYKVLQ